MNIGKKGVKKLQIDPLLTNIWPQLLLKTLKILTFLHTLLQKIRTIIKHLRCEPLIWKHNLNFYLYIHVERFYMY